jgi:tRNA 2-selenouridine synthase
MVEKIVTEEFMLLAESSPVIDVRSPDEYEQGHIPSSFNLPLFDDVERAIVGTIYKNSGRDAAVLKGLEFAGPKLAGFVKTVARMSPQKEILLHCWRGGMRSEQMAWLFDQAGFSVKLLNGGYKAYRHFIRESFRYNARVTIIGGLTGTGKTDILRELVILGEQVLDLEKIANHRGSVFGGLGQERQPTSEQFENNIYQVWKNFDPGRRIWMEDESRSIGNVFIPDPLYEKIISSAMINVEIPHSTRIGRIVMEYSGSDPDSLKDSFRKISEKLGGTRTQEAFKALDHEDYKLAVKLALEYYDKSYRHALSRRTSKAIHTLSFEDDDPATMASLILKLADDLSI